MEHYKPEEVARQRLDSYAFRNELYLRAVRDFGLERAVVPRCFPLGVADHLRANGIELEVDQRFFDDRRRVKNAAGAGRHPPGAEGGRGRDGGGAGAAAARRAA